MLTDWSFWFSIITAVVAIIALVQTRQQIKLSNKQHLFYKVVLAPLQQDNILYVYRIDRKSVV